MSSLPSFIVRTLNKFSVIPQKEDEDLDLISLVAHPPFESLDKLLIQYPNFFSFKVIILKVAVKNILLMQQKHLVFSIRWSIFNCIL